MTQGADTMDGSSGRILCRLDTMADGDAVGVEVMLDGVMESLIVIRQGQCARAYLNVCPHAGRRLDWAPGRFLLKDGILVCAVHGASFKAESGLCVGGPCRGDSLHEIPVTVNAVGEVELAGR
ncbi:MAG TPA: Rieske (2Fe-2S) protein [Rhodanobacteraceae bacterium]|nr:Rieske (2Fe-2S) protein [Rhodanobacteraceae bacterium]